MVVGEVTAQCRWPGNAKGRVRARGGGRLRPGVESLRLHGVVCRECGGSPIVHADDSSHFSANLAENILRHAVAGERDGARLRVDADEMMR